VALEKYWEEKQAYDSNHKVNMVRIVTANSPTLNKSVLLQNISDIPNMTDAQLRNFIDHHFLSILNSVFSGSNINEHVKCFTDVRFLDAFIDVLQTVKFYDNDVVVKINNICYDYISLNDPANKNPAVVDRMLRIGTIINRTLLPRMLGLGLSNNLACILLIARHSSFNLDICVRRVNFIIITQPKVLMTQEMITEIFRIIYSDIGIWARVFQYFMLDVIPEYNENEPNSWVTEEIEEINSIINLAVLDILNTETTATIRAAIINYAEAYNILNKGKPYRFSLQTLSDDYDRINTVVYHLMYQESIIAP
jgi:hypothetical protein